QHPVSWKVSPDGSKLLGHMVLHKTFEDPRDPSGKKTLGLKVTGGRMTEHGYVGAFVTKVKKGSVADTVANLTAGDEVVMWNGKCLRNLSFDDVYDVIFASQNDFKVELAVER
ncbi:hypothetical protein HELRODRAFT_137115, partial [Helobdella robusta]|uniref:PDZ domain-containing protein n=1 Tax=Helobdella robusta TaxID=6412 RepID=T1EIH7_HELRO